MAEELDTKLILRMESETLQCMEVRMADYWNMAVYPNELSMKYILNVFCLGVSLSTLIKMASMWWI